MFGFPPRIIVFDTEYTTWKGAQERQWSGAGEHKEIVQIGAIMVETQNFTELKSITLFVKPKKNPILSDYFIKLTGIDQATVNREGINYVDALKKITEWSEGLLMYCWGEDGSVLAENAKFLGIDFPIASDRIRDIRQIFKSHGVPIDEYMSSTIPRYFGKEPPPRPHDGLNDARSIVEGLKALVATVAGS